jgi:hypothetical protein
MIPTPTGVAGGCRNHERVATTKLHGAAAEQNGKFGYTILTMLLANFYLCFFHAWAAPFGEPCMKKARVKLDNRIVKIVLSNLIWFGPCKVQTTTARILVIPEAVAQNDSWLNMNVACMLK